MAGELAGIQVEGLREVLRDLRRLRDDETPKAIKAANLDAAKAVEPVAQAEAPKRSGRLARSVRASATKRVGTVKAGAAGKAKLYAGVIHFGWARRRIRANPFLDRAINRTIPLIRDTYERAMNAAIGRF